MKMDLWQHGRGGMCLLEELRLLLVQHGYDMSQSLPPHPHASASADLAPGHDSRKCLSRRNSLGASHSSIEERRPDVRLTQPMEQKSISYQQQLQQLQLEDVTGNNSSELPPGSLLKEQSVLVQNHVLGLCKRFMKWLDELDECVQEGLESSISSTADRMRVGMIEHYRLFLKNFQREVVKLSKHRAGLGLLLVSPGSRFSTGHVSCVDGRVGVQRRLCRVLQKKCLQVSGDQCLWRG